MTGNTMVDVNKSPTCWTRPNDVMRLHRLKMKKRALLARMDNSQSRGDPLELLHNLDPSKENANSSEDQESKNNPFKCNLAKKFKSSNSSPANCDLDVSCDNTLFQLLHQSEAARNVSSDSLNDSFATFLGKLSESQSLIKAPETSLKNTQQSLPVDWSLKSKVRFFSKKAFAWSQNLKTPEEASGTTGYVRCLNLGTSSAEVAPLLDKSPNAQFHQCCLVWQHPSLPWLSLFPRCGPSLSGQRSSKASAIPLDISLRECLHADWCKSFRSLYQLVRVRQCPYFYVCANKFTCLFRAPGIGGITEIHALISPTTSGFRDMLKNEGIDFTMPLRKDESSSKPSSSTSSPTDPGYDTQDSSVLSPGDSLAEVDSEEEEILEEGEEEETLEWLQSMGVADSHIKKLNASQGKKASSRLRQMDKRPCSLVLVQDVDVPALFNLLMNCRSSIANLGPLAGVPPTLLAPVAFHGATLMPLKVGQRSVCLNAEKVHCVELTGPILPHALRDVCSLLEPTQTQFSATCSIADHSRAFSMLPALDSHSTDVFARENLRDCGLLPSTLQALSQVTNTQVLESIRFAEESYVCES